MHWIPVSEIAFEPAGYTCLMWGTAFVTQVVFPLCVRLVSCMHSGFTLYVRYLPCMQSRIGTPDICLVPGISVFNHSLRRLSVYLGANRPAIEGAIESAISLSLAAIATDASQSDFGGSIFTWIQCIVVRLKLCFYLTTASLLGWTKSALWKYQHSESITVKLLKFNEIERFLWFLWILLIYEVFIFISFLLKFRHIGFILPGISPWKPVDSIESTVYNVDPIGDLQFFWIAFLDFLEAMTVFKMDANARFCRNEILVWHSPE